MKLRFPWSPRHQDGPDFPRVAVMGALRSGTNLVAGLLEKYWRVLPDFGSYGWKHAGVPILSPSSAMKYPDMPIIWVCKNPHAFVVSLHRYRMLSAESRGISIDGALDFAEFLRSPIKIWDSQLAHSPRLRFANPVEYWNFTTWNLETLDGERFRTLGFNYEELLANPEMLTQVESLLRVKRRAAGPIQLPTERMGRGRKSAKTGSGAFNADEYASQSYLTSYSQADLALVASQVDPWLMKRRGYVLP